MSGSNGQVLLLPSTTASTASGDLAGNPGVLDAVGFGTTPTSYEGAATGVALTSTTSAQRAAAGTDSDNNADDFSEATPTPENAGGTAPRRRRTFTGSIADIQGTGTATSPHVGDVATTSGVVTAAYPTGGFNGFYLQTPGTGGGTDATPGASDAIFVYGSAARRAWPSATTCRSPGWSASSTARPRSRRTRPRTSPRSPTRPAPHGTGRGPPDGDADREAHESELLDLSGAALHGHATTTPPTSTPRSAWPPATSPLIAPTEVADAQDAAAIAAVDRRQRRPARSPSTTARASTSCRTAAATTRTSRCPG